MFSDTQLYCKHCLFIIRCLHMKDESKSIGGKARALSLTPKKRKEIAKLAAEKRWEKKIPKATHTGEITIGEIIIPCAVLQDGRRVLSEKAIDKNFGVSGGKTYRLRDKIHGEIESGPLPIFLASKALQPFIYSVFEGVDLGIVEYTTGGKKSSGYEADILPKVCEVWLKARESDTLQISQLPKAKKAEILMRGLATIGIVALVDEATGYQDIRDRQALQAILDKYLTDEWAKWTKTFPDNFYKELFRLKGLSYPTMEGGQKPGYVGHWTNDIVYSRIAPGVLTELRNLNPRTDNRGRKRKFHQFLTRDIGHPALTEHISNVTFLMSGCSDWEDFKKRLNQAKPKFGDTVEMDF